MARRALRISMAFLAGLSACSVGGLAGCSGSSEPSGTDAGADATGDARSSDGASRTDSGRPDGASADTGSHDGHETGSETGPGDSGSASLVAPRSCAPGGAGMTNCGLGGSGSESCCTSLEVPGGTYDRTYDTLVFSDAGITTVTLAADGGPGGEADPATLSGFSLDKYLVTVGRFRQFVEAWDGGSGLDGGSGYEPPAGSGKHTHLNGGLGLANSGDLGTYETGWVASDDSKIAPTNTNLACAVVDPFYTWTTTAGSQENLPISCASWWEAYAFCIWDGGFLPSEAEWGYAAAGEASSVNTHGAPRMAGTTNQYAIYQCNYPSGAGGNCTGVANIAPVGTPTLGAGRWGQLDMAGEDFEWNLDWYATYVDPCTGLRESDIGQRAGASWRLLLLHTRGIALLVPILLPPDEPLRYGLPLRQDPVTAPRLAA